MRWLFRIVGFVGVVVLVALAGFFLIPGEKIAKIAADQVKTYTGRDLVFEGKVSVTLWPVLGVETGPVTFGNADWAGPEPMLRAQSLAIGISAPDLLRGTIRVKRIVAVAPELRLMTRADGTGNWQFSTATVSDESSAASGSVPLTLERLTISDARLIYTAAGGDPVEFKGVDLSLIWPSASEPADIVISLHPAGQKVTIAANIGGFDHFIDGEISAISARITTPGGDMNFVGRASLAGDATGRVALETTNTTNMLAALGLGDIDIPKGLGQAIKLAANVTYTTDGRLSVRELSLSLDDNQLSGALDVVLDNPPRITAQINAKALDFSALSSGADGATTGTAGWPKDAIDASALALMDATITMNIQSLNTGMATIGPVQAVLRIDRARAVLELTKVSAYGGTIVGQVVANNRSGFSVGGTLEATKIELKQALTELAGIERLEGRANARIKFLGSGGSVDAIMQSLSGKGGLSMARGVISGFDLDRLIRSGDGTGGTTVFDDMSATYVIKGGVLMNDDLLLKVSKIQADGTGQIGLGAQTINYLFTPVLGRSEDKPGLSIPVRIQGPWSDLNIRPDLSAAADIKLEELENKAKNAVQSKLEAELGVTVGDGEDAKEVLRDAVEDKIKNKLFELLGKN